MDTFYITAANIKVLPSRNDRTFCIYTVTNSQQEHVEKEQPFVYIFIYNNCY